jgi:hypothetical protein
MLLSIYTVIALDLRSATWSSTSNIFRYIGFSMSSSFADLLAGDCTSCRVKQDKSTYWHPAMYFQDEATGKFEVVPQVGGMLA